MITPKRTAYSVARIAARVAKRPGFLLAAAVCTLVLRSNAIAGDGPGVMRISISDPPAAAPATPVPEPTSVGRATLGHGDTCDGDANCNGAHGHCGIWHTCLGGPENGYGCRFLDFHSYTMAYPVNPWYYDPRDTRVYAAAGFGAPMTVPLAPNVQTQVNYGWGIPASRITPISRVAPQSGAMMGAMAPMPNEYVAPAAPIPPVMPTLAPSR
jgi:hypothetical protein